MPDGESAPPPSTPAALESATLQFEYAGPYTRNGWPVYGEDAHQVAWVHQPTGLTAGRRPYQVTTLEGAPILTLAGDTGVLPRIKSPLPVLDAQSQEVGQIGQPESPWTFGSGDKEVSFQLWSAGTFARRLRGTVNRAEGRGVVGRCRRRAGRDHHPVQTERRRLP